jgi:hypothetical protein
MNAPTTSKTQDIKPNAIMTLILGRNDQIRIEASIGKDSRPFWERGKS